MAVRLNKALKELNVGINTVAEFLQKKGMPLEDATPNAKLTDEQHNLLMKEFGSDKTLHSEVKADIQKRKEREEREKQERKERERQERERKEQEARLEKERLEKEREERKPQFKIVGNINDIKEEERKRKEAEAVAKAAAEAEKQAELEAAKAAEKEEKAQAKPKKGGASPADRLEANEDGVYRLNAPEGSGVQFKQVGFIDLDSINSKTRPDRKSASERKKERQEKRQQQQAMQEGGKKKRNRIGKEKIDVEAAGKQANAQQQQKQQQQKQQQNAQAQQQGGKKKKKNKQVKLQELSDEDVAKQVKDTLARLTQKQEKKGVKYRKEKREAVRDRMAEEEELENME
ncbi:MAG: translation initiation factor IF-2, partial [Bacteroidaceae bacterium]|nr:translation initiation factor IF-2 [Bacteroidaceae bacterium]